MSVQAADVKKLREVSGAGFMDCKKALAQSNGDLEQAKRILKEQGMAKAEKKSSRDASEGAVVFKIADDKHSAALVEINCETDFVARSDTFQSFSALVADVVLSQKLSDTTELLAAPLDGYANVEAARHEAVLKLGENIQVARAQYINANADFIAGYSHGNGLSVAVVLNNDAPEVGKNIAMHIAALNPAAVKDTDIPEALLQDERNIYLKQLQDTKKPQEILDKIIEGKMKKFAAGLCLYGQAYVKEPKQTVAEYLQQSGCDVQQFVRFALGEAVAE